MKASLNLKSKSGIHRLISALEERGFIKRLAHKARALEVIKLPETASANDIYNSFSPSVIKGGLDEEQTNSDELEVPVLGKIVVALIDDHEAMLKRKRRKGKTIALESANKNYETKIFGPDRVKVQGILVSLYRNFH